MSEAYAPWLLWYNFVKKISFRKDKGKVASNILASSKHILPD